MWNVEKTALGYLLVFRDTFGEIWFAPTEYGHVRSVHSTVPTMSLALQELARAGEALRATLPFNRYGSKLSQDRGNYCAALCAALNEAKLFPTRKAA